ncbi:hypothetical protein OBV_33060 [Oscillibacter valericigenes Sjm18-20]|nr:hypothetical protein OBV_33060 [Oscillibacter valericigenes Sjm18-20]
MELKRSRYNIAVNLICLLLLSGIIVCLLLTWKKIPDKIPGHYNAMGVVDRWGNKGELLILPIVGWILYFMMTMIERFPQAWNTGITVTEGNKERIYPIIGNMLGTMKLSLVSVFVFLTINSALAKELPAWFLPAVVILIFGSIVYFIAKLIKAR